MKPRKLIGLMVLLSIAGMTAVQAEVPPVPATPAPVAEVVSARPFTLKEGYAFEWRKERPMVEKGLLLVLKVDPDLVYPRQTLEPVLYVGDQTAERVNNGYPSGRVVAIVPGVVDLTKAPIWFGTPNLPERVDTKTVKDERARAELAGIKPFASEKVTAAHAQGGEHLEVMDRYELRRAAAGLIQAHSPQETDLINALLMPRNR